MMMDQLALAVKEISPVCLGLDTSVKYLPQYLMESDMNVEEKILQFNKDIIDATWDLVACYKVQIAYYESMGLKGMKAYSETLKYIKSKSKISIGDIKRGDISATGDMYARAHFTGDFEADIITVNAYMGEDAVSPYYSYIKEKGKGIFVLLRTSNPGAGETQNVLSQQKPYYHVMAELIKQWGNDFIGSSGYSSMGAVVGLTAPKEFQNIKQIMPNTFFLVPGYGAQGGRGEDIKNILKKEPCAVVNSSRGIITAHKGMDETKTYVNLIRKAAQYMKEDLYFG